MTPGSVLRHMRFLVLAVAPMGLGAQAEPLRLPGAAPPVVRAPALKPRHAKPPARPTPIRDAEDKTDAKEVRDAIARLRASPVKDTSVKEATAPPKASPTEAVVAPVVPIIASPQPALAQDYCAAIADAAREERAARLAVRIAAMEARLVERTAELERRRDELQIWMRRQDDMRRKAEDGVVAVYGRMKPETAAAQIAAMDEKTAAAVLVRLNARTAGAILNDVPTARAARLAELMGLSNDTAPSQ